MHHHPMIHVPRLHSAAGCGPRLQGAALLRSVLAGYAMLVLASGQVSAAPLTPAADPIAEAFFAPELVMQHQQAIGLTEPQRETLKTEMRQAQLQFTELQWQLQDQVEHMVKLIGTAKVDEQKVLAQLQEVLSAEREVKRIQITLLVRIKNQLNTEQQQQLRQLRGTPAP